MKTRHYFTSGLAIVAVVAFALFYYAPEPTSENQDMGDELNAFGEAVMPEEDPPSDEGAGQNRREGINAAANTSEKPAVPDSEKGELEITASRYDKESAESALHRERMWESTDVLEEKTRELGYFNAEEREIYESYPIDTLETLLQDGDIRAYPVIIDQYASDDSREYITWASFTAAIHGSTPAIGMLAHLESSQAEYERLMENESEARDRLLHAQALYKSATALGDPYLGASAQENAKKFDLQLSERDEQRVDDLAEQFITALNEKRREQGLSELVEASDELLKHYQRLGISSPWED